MQSYIGMITKLYSFHHPIQYDLNKNALIVPLKQSIIKVITLPPQDHMSGRVMAYPCEGREALCLGEGHLDQDDLRRCRAKNLKAQVSDLKDLALRSDAGMVA